MSTIGDGKLKENTTYELSYLPALQLSPADLKKITRITIDTEGVRTEVLNKLKNELQNEIDRRIRNI